MIYSISQYIVVYLFYSKGKQYNLIYLQKKDIILDIRYIYYLDKLTMKKFSDDIQERLYLRVNKNICTGVHYYNQKSKKVCDLYCQQIKKLIS